MGLLTTILPPLMRDVAIEVEDIHKRFGDNAVLRGVTFTIPRGQITTIIGGSGSGKSVLVKHIIGLLKPDQGAIRIDGIDIAKMSDRELTQVRRKFGMLFQHAALFDSMSVGENVAFPLVEHTTLSRKEIQKEVAEKLDVLGLAGTEKKWPADLSGGMRKRVALARALAMNPSFLIYDEPTTGLDPVLTKQVDEMIADTQHRLGVTSIIISHDMASTFRLAHQIAMLARGQVIVTGTPAEVVAAGVPEVDAFIAASGVRFEELRAQRERDDERRHSADAARPHRPVEAPRA